MEATPGHPTLPDRPRDACRGRKRLIRHAATPWYSLISPPSSSRRSIWRMGLGVEKTPIVAGA
jgi:hypothetical protein